MTELNKELAMQAHCGTSFSPEVRGKAIIDGFSSHLAQIRDDLMKSAETDEDREFISAEMRILKSGYASKMNDQLSSQSRCMSTMIAGPSNFNTRRAEKANRAYENKFDATNAYLERAISSIRRRLNKRQVEAAGGEIEVMKAELANAEKSHDIMKACNKLIRSKKLSDEERIAQMVGTLGLSEHTAQEVLTPDYMGRIGFAHYSLSNSNANIRRMRERVEEMQKKEDTPTTEREFDGGMLIDNCDADRIQIDFDEKPDDTMRAKLKGSGWRWAPSVMMWQRKRTNAAIRSAKEILEVD